MAIRCEDEQTLLKVRRSHRELPKESNYLGEAERRARGGRIEDAL